MRIYKTRADFTKLQAAQNPSVFAGTICTITDEAANPMYTFQNNTWNGLGGGGGGGNAWRKDTLFALMANNTIDINASVNTVRTITVDHNSMVSIKVVRRATRFRLAFSNGMPGTAGGTFTLSGKLQVPSKNSSGVTYLPIRFNGQTSYSVPAGGGAIWYSDYISWPCEVGDLMFCKLYCYNGGAAFDMPLFAAPDQTDTRSLSGQWDSGKDNHGSDASGVAYGLAPWASYNIVGGMFRPAAIETDCSEAERKTTVDVWGDSLASGNGTLYPSFLGQLLTTAAIPFAILAVSGSNQSQIPSRALGRIAVARGDIAICNHGRNATTATAELVALWKFLRGLGYRKIIQTTTTNITDAGNTVITNSGQSMRDFINSQAGTVDGPDVIWDVYSMAADTATGLWKSGYTTDGLHPNDTGNTGIYTSLVAANALNDLA